MLKTINPISKPVKNTIFTQTKYEPALLTAILEQQKAIKMMLVQILKVTKDNRQKESLDSTLIQLRITMSNHFLLKHHCLYPYILKKCANKFETRRIVYKHKSEMYSTYQSILHTLKKKSGLYVGAPSKRKQLKALVLKILVNQDFEKVEIFPLYTLN